MSDQANDTKVSKVEMTTDEVNQLLGMPTGDNVLTPEEKKPNLFSTSKVDTSFIDKEEEEEETPELGEDGKPKVTPITKLDVDSILDIQNPLDGEPVKSSKKLDKNGLVDIYPENEYEEIVLPYIDSNYNNSIKYTDRNYIRNNRQRNNYNKNIHNNVIY